MKFEVPALVSLTHTKTKRANPMKINKSSIKRSIRHNIDFRGPDRDSMIITSFSTLNL